MSVRNLISENNFNANLDVEVLTTVVVDAEEVNTKAVTNGLQNLKVKKPIAFSLNEEYVKFNGTSNNIGSTIKGLDTLTILNNGNGDYLPIVNSVLRTVTFPANENMKGCYLLNLFVFPTNLFVSNEHLHVNFWDDAHPDTRTCESILNGGSAPSNTAGYTFSGVYIHTGTVEKKFKFFVNRTTGSTNVDLDVTFSILRLK